MIGSAEKQRLISWYREPGSTRTVMLKAAVGLLTIVVVTTLGAVSAPDGQIASAQRPTTEQQQAGGNAATGAAGQNSRSDDEATPSRR